VDRIATVRYPRLVPKDAAVFAAYGWPPSISDDELLAKLLELNLSRAK